MQEVPHHVCKCRLFLMNILIRIVCVHLAVHIFRITASYSWDTKYYFVQLRNTLFIVYTHHFSVVHTLGFSAAREQEASLNTVQYLTFDLWDNKLGIATSVPLLTESLLLVGDDSTTFQGV